MIIFILASELASESNVTYTPLVLTPRYLMYSMDNGMGRALTRLAISLFAGTELTAVFCAG